MKKKLKLFKKVNKKQLIISSISLVAILLVCTIIPNVLAQDNPIKEITITSSKTDYEQEEGGAWKVNKSASWIDNGVARITFNVKSQKKIISKNKDVLLIIDNSSSMNGDKLSKIKDDSIELVDTIVDEGGEVALINFNDKATILSDFTNEKVRLEGAISSLEYQGLTNYYSALKNSEQLLKNYRKKDNRQLVMVFMTDGEPNVDTPNEVAEYEFLKSKYDYVDYTAVQYDMGKDISEAIKKISDNQYVASTDTNKNILLEAVNNPEKYEEFKIIDYIDKDYFEVDNVYASLGKVDIDGNIVTWDMKDLYRSGKSEYVTIDIKLKSEYLQSEELLPTNKQEKIISTMGNNTEEIISNKTPKLLLKHEVEYDVNAPEDCNIDNIPSTTKHNAFDTVEISDYTPECSGYQFKGWKLNDGTKKLNEDYFIMPDHDVKLIAEWGKVNIKKTMDGEVYTKPKSIINVVPSSQYAEELWKYKSNITKVIFQDEINEMPSATYTYDISEENNRSVMAHLVLNDDNSTYTAYIQGDGKIYANENSSRLFSIFPILEEIENIELLDTSDVKDMTAMFQGCYKLKSLDLSSFDTSKVENMTAMFYKCYDLAELNLGNMNTSKVTSMSTMFSECTSLETLDVSSFDTRNVTTMHQMFGKCNKIANLDLSNFNTSKVTTMMYMFAYNDELKTLNIKNFDTSNVTNMNYMFTSCPKLQTITIDEFKAKSTTTTDYLFTNDASLTGSPLIPQGIEKIGDYSFYGCSSLTGNLTIPTGVKEVGKAAFHNCSGLNGTITLPSTLTTIGEYAFNMCSNLTGNLVIPEGIKTISKAAFQECSKLNGTLTLPSTLQTIGSYAFSECSNLSGTLTIPEGVKTLGKAAFHNCSGLNGILTLPSTLQTIGSYAFNHCYSFQNTTLTIPRSVTIIGDDATSGSHVFYDFATRTITEYIVESGNTKFKAVDGVLYNIDETRLVAYPASKPGISYKILDGVTAIDELAFSRAGSSYTSVPTTGLKKLILPDSYTITTTLPSTFLNTGNSLAVGIYIYTGISEIAVEDTNTKYKTIDGLIYSKDGTILWYSPINREGIINIEPGVTTIGKGAFYNGNEMHNYDARTNQIINIPNTVTQIENLDITELTRLGPSVVHFEEGCVYQFNSNGKIVKN